MATSRVKIATQTTSAGELLRLCRTMQDALAQLPHVKEVMDSMVNGADYSMIATEFGLADPTQAQTLYNCIAGAKATWLADFNTLALARKVGS
jgi:hypothetical protein